MSPPDGTRDGTDALEDHLYNEVLAHIERATPPERVLLTATTEDAAAQRRALAEKILYEERRILRRADREHIIQNVANRITGFGPIEILMRDPEITEIMVNSPTDIFIEKDGQLRQADASVRFRDDEHILDIIDRIVGPLGRRVDKSSPYVDARLPDGSRVHAIIDPLSVRGATLTIRRFSARPFDLDLLLEKNALSPDMQTFLKACVRAQLNILISGGTGSGKTSTLNAIAREIPDNERLITIEDTAELRIEHRNLVSLEARPPNIEGKGAVTIRELVANALRMRPHRIIVGEVRRGEAFDMLQAMNTGHPGSLTTIHANSAEDALHRLEAMVVMAGLDLPIAVIRQHIASAISLIIQQERLRDGSRKIISISEMAGLDQQQYLMHDIFRFHIERDDLNGVVGYFTATGCRPNLLSELQKAGEALPDDFFDPKALR